MRYSPAIYNEIINYLSGEQPARLATRWSQMRFRKAMTDYHYDGNVLYFRGKRVVQENAIEATIARYYNDPALRALSRDKLYEKVSRDFAGITVNDVDAYLKRQPAYQLNRKVVKLKSVRPLALKRPLAQFQMDIVDMSDLAGHNRQRRYLLNIIDCFSRKAWSFALTNRTGASIAQQLRGLFESGQIPSVLHSDNGTEFTSAEVAAVCGGYAVKQVFGLPYKSTSQGTVERFNATLRQLIRVQISQSGSSNYIDVLQRLVDSYNNTTHSSTKLTPNELHQAPRAVRNEAAALQRDAADRKLRANRAAYTPVAVGDSVRVSFLATTEGRKRHKLGLDKMKNRWSEETYTVVKITQPRRGDRAVTPPRQYFIADANAVVQRRKYYIDALQRVVLPQAAPPPRNHRPPAAAPPPAAIIEAPRLRDRRNIRPRERLNL